MYFAMCQRTCLASKTQRWAEIMHSEPLPSFIFYCTTNAYVIIRRCKEKWSCNTRFVSLYNETSWKPPFFARGSNKGSSRSAINLGWLKYACHPFSRSLITTMSTPWGTWTIHMQSDYLLFEIFPVKSWGLQTWAWHYLNSPSYFTATKPHTGCQFYLANLPQYLSYWLR